VACEAARFCGIQGGTEGASASVAVAPGVSLWFREGMGPVWPEGTKWEGGGERA
jgi:hypothetical protein